MPVDWDKLAETVADDFEMEFGEDQKLTGAELKTFLKQNKGELQRQQAERAALDQEIAGLKKYQTETSALFSEAAKMAGREMDPNARRDVQAGGGLARNLSQPKDRFEEEYGNDPLLAPFAARYGERVMRDVQEQIVKPLIENQLAPEFKRRDDTLTLLTSMLLGEKQRNDFRDITEWPEGTNLDAVRKFGLERKYFVPGGEQFGVIDFRRVNEEMMAPLRHERAIKEAEARGEENAALRLRQTTNIVQMPNRAGGGGSKGPSRSGSGTPDNVIDRALGEAALDRQTMQMLSQIQK